MPSQTYILEVAEGNKINVSSFFLRISRNYIPAVSKHIVAVFHANAAMCFQWAVSIHAEGTWSEPLRLCTRDHQSVLQMLSRVRSWRGPHFLEEFPASEDALEEVTLVWFFWEPAGWEDGFFLITGVLFLLLNTLLGSSLFTKESASSARRAVLMVMGLYMLNHCWKAGWWRKKKEVKLKLQSGIFMLHPSPLRPDFNHTPLISLQFTGLCKGPSDKDIQGSATATVLELPHIPERRREPETNLTLSFLQGTTPAF